MNKLSKAIEQAKKDCFYDGNGDIRIDDQITIRSEWEEWEFDDKYDVITIYIYDSNIVKIRYQLEETKTYSNE